MADNIRQGTQNSHTKYGKHFYRLLETMYNFNFNNFVILIVIDLKFDRHVHIVSMYMHIEAKS